MTTKTTTTSSTDTPSTTASTSAERAMATDRATAAGRTVTSDEGGLTATARQVADSVAGAAGEMTARIPDVAQGTRAAVGEANRLVRRGSDDSLRLAGAGSLGLALGLFIGGAARILVLLALVPALMVGATLLERSDGRSARLTD